MAALDSFVNLITLVVGNGLLLLKMSQIAHPLCLFDFYVEMVGGWCHKNLVAFPVLMVQLPQLHRSSSPTALLVSYQSSLDVTPRVF